MRRTQLRVGAFFGLVILGAFTSGIHTETMAIESDYKTNHVVEIRDFKFTPNQVKVKVGDTVTWKNLDAVPHTATGIEMKWDSQLLANEAEWSLTIKKSTGGEYFCIYHPSMKGLIVVQP